MAHPTLRIIPPSFLFALRFIKINKPLKLAHTALRIKPPSFLFASRFLKINEHLKFHMARSAHPTLNTQKAHEISGFPIPPFCYVATPRYIVSSIIIPPTTLKRCNKPLTVLVLNLINVTGI